MLSEFERILRKRERERGRDIGEDDAYDILLGDERDDSVRHLARDNMEGV